MPRVQIGQDYSSRMVHIIRNLEVERRCNLEVEHFPNGKKTKYFKNWFLNERYFQLRRLYCRQTKCRWKTKNFLGIARNCFKKRQWKEIPILFFFVIKLFIARTLMIANLELHFFSRHHESHWGSVWIFIKEPQAHRNIVCGSLVVHGYGSMQIEQLFFVAVIKCERFELRGETSVNFHSIQNFIFALGNVAIFGFIQSLWNNFLICFHSDHFRFWKKK